MKKDEDIARKLSVSGETNVAQSNELIEHKPKMTSYELKLFSALVASINYDDTELSEIRVPVKDVIKLLETDNKNGYGIIKRALVNLSKKQFQIEKENPDGTRTVIGSSYISSYRFTEGASVAYISVSKVFAPYLLSLQRNYTTYMLQNILRLGNPNAIRTYELLTQYKSFGKRFFSVSEYKEKLGISGMYKGNNSNLRRKVLIPCCEEISEKTDIITRATISGRGENARIEFIIIMKKDVAGKRGKIKSRVDNGDLEMLVDLMSVEIEMKQIFDQEQIEAFAQHILQLLPAKTDIGDALSIASKAYHTYLINAVKTKIDNPTGYYIALLESEIEKSDHSQ